MDPHRTDGLPMRSGHGEIRENAAVLAALERPAWREQAAQIHASGQENFQVGRRWVDSFRRAGGHFIAECSRGRVLEA